MKCLAPRPNQAIIQRPSTIDKLLTWPQ
jgi:hypothetical protein